LSGKYNSYLKGIKENVLEHVFLYKTKKQAFLPVFYLKPINILYIIQE